MSQFYVWDENNINIQNSSDFLNDNQRKNGFTSGTAASSSRTNTALRQSTLITAALMEMLTSYKDNSALTVRSSINDVKLAILDGFKNFEATNMTVTFTSGSNREALSSGETLSASMGKISSWLIALKALAFKSTVSTSDITSGAITSDKLANEAVTNSKIASSAVGTANIQAYAVNAAKLADSAVTTTKIANGAITSNKFANGATCPRATADDSGVKISTSYCKTNNIFHASGIKVGCLAILLTARRFQAGATFSTNQFAYFRVGTNKNAVALSTDLDNSDEWEGLATFEKWQVIGEIGQGIGHDQPGFSGTVYTYLIQCYALS